MAETPSTSPAMILARAEDDLGKGRVQRAIDGFQSVLDQDPDNYRAILHLAVLACRHGRYQLGAGYADRLLTLDDRQASDLAMLGSLFASAGRRGPAMRCYSETMVLDPDHAEAAAQIGYLYYRERRIDRAIDYYRRSLDIDPRQARVHHYLGNACRAAGRLDDAEHHYRESLAIAPSALVFYDLARTRKYGREPRQDQQDISAIRRFLARHGHQPRDEALLHFALGKIHDDCSDFDAAFDHFSNANRIQYEEGHPGIPELRTDVRAIRDLFSQEALRRSPAGSESRRPIFVVGAPRSGTSLVEQILASHSRVRGIGESPLISELATSPEAILGRPVPLARLVTEASEADLLQLADAYLERADRIIGDPGQPRIVDKMPDNAFLLGFVHLLFPSAPIVNCRRHPLDVCLSIFFQSFEHNRSYYCRLEETGEFYKAYLALNRYWKKAFPEAILDVFYEELVERQETVSRRLTDFCELPWEDACLRFHAADHPVVTASDWQVRQPVYRSSRYRWKNYDKHLGGLRDVLADEIAAYEAALDTRLKG